MFIEFGEKSLEDLYLTGATDDKKYERLPKDIKKRFVKVVNMTSTPSTTKRRLGTLKTLRLYGSMTSIDCYSIVRPIKAVLL